MKVPCQECPWRKDVPPGTWLPERFQNLAYTCQDDGTAMMACHKSRDGEEVPCAGFLVSVGYDSIGVRLAVFKGTVQLDDYEAPAPLYATFDEMLAANGVPVPRRNKSV